MSYTRGQPNRNDQGLTSQPILQENNDAVDDIFGVDHYQFSDTATRRGKHKAIRFVDQTADGNPETSSDEFAIFSKEDADENQELFARRPSSGSIIQITKNGFLSTGIIPAAAVNFDSSGDIQSQFNVSSVVHDATGRYTINFTNALPDNNYEWSVQAVGSSLIAAGVRSTTTYSNSVDEGFLRVEFRNTALAFINPVRASVMVFRRL